MRKLILSMMFTLLLLVSLANAPQVEIMHDLAYRIGELDAQASADSAAAGSTNVTSNLYDNSWATVSGTVLDASQAARDYVLTLRFNKEASAYGTANLSLWVTSPSSSTMTVYVYAYQSDANNINTSANTTFSIDTSSNKVYNVSVTNIMHTMDNFGWVKFRVAVSDTDRKNFQVAEARLELSDDQAPSIYFGTNPVDNINTSQTAIAFDMKCTENHQLSYMELWGNWTGSWKANQSNLTPYNNSYWNVTVQGIPQGRWLWGIRCNDSAGNVAWSTANRTLTVDTSGPSVDFTQPTEQNNTNMSYNYLFVNASFYEIVSEGNTCLLDIYNASGKANYTMGVYRNSTGGYCYYNATGQSTYRINYSVYVNDSANNFGVTSSRYANIDLTFPTATFGTSPQDNANSSVGSFTFEMKCTDNDQLGYMELWGNWTGSWKANQSNLTPYNNSYWNVTVQGIPQGRWLWGIRCNDSAGNIAWSTSNRTITVHELQASLVNPSPSLINNVVQNQTFTVNATVFCSGGNCGSIQGSLWYNSTDALPNALVSTSSAAVPFYVNESPALSVKPCPTNPLDDIGEYCNITWTINTTGETGEAWKMGVLFNSSSPDIYFNNTGNATVVIASGIVDVSMYFSSISFGEIIPSSQENEADGNDGFEYNITVNQGSTNTDIYINGTDLVNETIGYIGVGNITWSNTTNNFNESYNMSTEKTAVKLNVQPMDNVTLWFWLNVPPVYAGTYAGTICITSVENGQSP